MWRHTDVNPGWLSLATVQSLKCLFDFALQMVLTLLRANNGKLTKITGSKGKETLQAVWTMSKFTVMCAGDNGVRQECIYMCME